MITTFEIKSPYRCQFGHARSSEILATLLIQYLNDFDVKFLVYYFAFFTNQKPDTNVTWHGSNFACQTFEFGTCFSHLKLKLQV